MISALVDYDLGARRLCELNVRATVVVGAGARLDDGIGDERRELGGVRRALRPHVEHPPREGAPLVQVVGGRERERGLAQALGADEREQPLLLADGGGDELLPLELPPDELQREEGRQVVDRILRRKGCGVDERELGLRGGGGW